MDGRKETELKKGQKKETMIHGHRHIRGCEPTTLESTGYKQEPRQWRHQRKRKDIALKSQKNENTEDIEVSIEVSQVQSFIDRSA
jgi:hypothetical protein